MPYNYDCLLSEMDHENLDHLLPWDGVGNFRPLDVSPAADEVSLPEDKVSPSKYDVSKTPLSKDKQRRLH